MMLTEGVKLKASDILIEPLISEIRVRYRLDGILVDGSRLPKKIHHAVISRLMSCGPEHSRTKTARRTAGSRSGSLQGSRFQGIYTAVQLRGKGGAEGPG
jgi:hypothetical protein